MAENSKLNPDWDMLQKSLLDDDTFDALLSASLKPVLPPEDFSARVMAAVAAQPAPAAKPAKVIHFGWRRFAAGLGTCAAAVALFVGVTAGGIGDDPAALLTAKPVQVAYNVTPAITAPTEKTVKPVQPTPGKPVKTTTPDTTNTPTAVQQAPTEAPKAELPVQSSELILPRTAYGTTTEGTLATRLLATVEGNKLYQPAFAGKNAVFNTSDGTNVYAWRVELANPSEPQVSSMVAIQDVADASSMLQNTTPTVDATTVVESPDKTMLAQNSADGIWVSLLDGDVFKLTTESSGKLLVWSPDSSKLVFTNSNGALFVGYPLERRIYQLADGGVKDVCWHSNNKTLLYITDNDGADALYIIETY